MIPRECKRLAEVDFPIATVSKHAAREKSIRHGHPSTLHLWWARRPLASCRAVLLALLYPDPADPNCPDDFKRVARDLLPELVGEIGSEDMDLRRKLLTFIGDFANWDNAAKEPYLRISRALVKAAYPEETPLVVDPFAGGGSIPLEALRVGADAFSSDLNPVACLIQKVMLEDIPRYGPGLADELRRVGAEIKEQAKKELAEFYPVDPDGAQPIAYLWARTVRCESPNCGAEIPLMRSFWLCKKRNRKFALRYRVERINGKPPQIVFDIFEPKTENEVPESTVSRAKATCPACGNVLPADRVRAQLSSQRGGADAIFDSDGTRIGGARMTAVVTLRNGETGRHYRLPTQRDYDAVRNAQVRVDEILREWEQGGKQELCPIPDEPTPWKHGHRAIGAPRIYGMTNWGDLFTARQKVALLTLVRIINKLGEPIRSLTAIALDRTADGSASVSGWLASGEEIKHVFTRQALPMVWDFGESNYISSASRSWTSAVYSIGNVLAEWPGSQLGQVQNADATKHPLPNDTSTVWFTDPPYYDAIPYSDISDFFYVWLKRTLPKNSLIGQNSNLTPKRNELTVTTVDSAESVPKDKRFYEQGMSAAFTEGRRILRDDGAGCVVFAHKTTEGWEALLNGMISGGFTLTGSWPVQTEMRTSLNARDTASLASSIHLVVRPRPASAPIGDWSTVLRELPGRVDRWMRRLEGEGIRGADLVFACIGPALEIFSRYPSVETAEGRVVPLGEYLEKVWEVVGRAALRRVLGGGEESSESVAESFEEDARMTAIFLWTLQDTEARNGNGSNGAHAEDDDEDAEPDDEDAEESPKKFAGGFSLPFDVVIRFTRPLGIRLDEWEDRVVKTTKGIVRLLSVSDRAKVLFGLDGASAVADDIEASPERVQLSLFPDAEPSPRIRGRKKARRANVNDEDLRADTSATTLDRVHAAMLLQKSGRTAALRALVKAEQQRGPEFVQLANALSALYPRGSEEKRLVDAMLVGIPR